MAVVVNHNGGQGLLDCLAALVADPLRPAVVVVDNASTDGSAAAAQTRFADIALLRNRHNRLFAPAANQGLAWAGQRQADFMLVLNPDVVPEPGCLAALVAFMRAQPTVGACQPLLTRADRPELIQNAGCRIGVTGRAVDDLAAEPLAAAGECPRPVLGVTGACLLLGAKALGHAGPFCADFGMYFEDVDLSLRLASLGYALYCLPTARARHVGGAAARAYPAWKKTYLCERNALLMAVRCYPAAFAAAALVLGPASAAVAALRQLAAGRLGQAAALLAGSLAGVAGAPGQLAHRRHLTRLGARPQRFWPLVAATTLFPSPVAGPRSGRQRP